MPHPVERRPSRVARRVLVVLVPAVALLLAGMWLYGRRTVWLADEWRHNLATLPDEQLLPRLRQATDLGKPGVALLADALYSSRGALAEAAAEAIDEELYCW